MYNIERGKNIFQLNYTSFSITKRIDFYYIIKYSIYITGNTTEWYLDISP